MAFLPTTIVSGLFKPLLDKLTTELTSEYHLRRDLRKEIQKLHLTLSLIESVIEDAEEKQINNKPVREWLRSLKQVTLDADDVLDEYATRIALKTRGDDESGHNNNNIIISIEGMVWKILSPCLTCYDLPPNIFTRFNFLQDISNGDIAHNIKAIRERLEDIDRNRSRLGLQTISSGTRRFEITTQWRRSDTTSLLADESAVVGRDEDTQKIIQLLLCSSNEAESSNNQRYVSILPIVGMGGVGKTTLARLVFNEKTVKEHFPLRMWVCVSDDFHVERVTKEIIESSSKSTQDQGALINLGTMTNLDAIQHRLMNIVEGKLFLLVLDDVWNENDSSKWHNLLEPLKFGGKGSKVIVTTRSRKVADIIPRRMDPINVGALSPDDLWKVFHKFAFGDTRVEHMQLEVIGKQITKRLKGLPLAAKTIGCLLNSNLNIEHWRRISQSDILALDQGENGILPALKLSFEHLPVRQKQCFTYCSLFPKDHIFGKDELVQLWMGQCMIQKERDLEMEDIGRCYFDDLLSRSFFQHHPYNNSCYVMHDLIHDLAVFEAKDDCFRMGDVVSKDIPETIRHISLFTDNLQPTNVINLCKYENLRTLLFLRGYKFDFGPVLNVLFTKLKRLRVLGLGGCRVEELPESIGQLKHLRCIDLSSTPLKKLPESLNLLHNLEVLNLKYCLQLDTLPKGITKLINLRHLLAEESLISNIEGVENLTSLQELESFDASKHEIREMKGMNHLRVLSIKGLDNVKGMEEARQAEMNYKNHLKRLKLEWSIENREITTEKCRLDEEVLEGLQPNADLLVDLNITGYAGMNYPSWMMPVNQSSSFLETIVLMDCGKLAFLPPMGHLPFLKELSISGMSGIKQVGEELYGSSRVVKKAFPSLVTLEFGNMSEWEVWKGAEEGQSFFPCLRTLLVFDCPKLMELPPLPPGLQGTTSSTTTTTQAVLSSSLVELTIVKCPNLKDSITFDGALPSLLPWLQNSTSLESLQMSSELLGCLLPVTGGSVLSSRLQHLIIIGDDCMIINNNNNIAPSLDEEGLLLYWCLQHITSVEHLYIDGCRGLTSLPGEVLRRLTSLKYLHVVNCQQLTSLELQPLPTSPTSLHLVDCIKLVVATSSCSSPSPLEHLGIINCSNLRTMGGVLQRFPSLRSLYIHNCENLQYLPRELGSLSSLWRLWIDNCPQIQSLPDIERLPASLIQLHINGCPLEERCQRERGPDWHKISHIPNIEIGGDLI